MTDDARDLSGKIGLDTTDFKSAIASVNRELRVIESGFRASAAALGDWTQDASGLELRLEALTKKIDLQRTKVERLQAEYRRVADETGETSRASQDLLIKLNRETETLNKMERELRDTSQSLDKVGKESKTTGDRTDDLRKSEDRARVSTDRFGGAVHGLTGRLRSATSGIGGMVASLGRLAGRLAIGVAGAAVVATAAVGALAASTIGPASDLNETISKTEQVFEDMSDEVLEFGRNSASSLGMSSNAALSAASTYGNLFRAMGIGLDASAEMSMGLVNLGADLASFNNMSPEDVLDSLRAGLSGETEPLKRLGVNINQAIIQEKAYEMGLIKRGEAMDAAARAQATYQLVLEQTTLAQGDFERTSGGLANQQRILTANIENLRAKIGTALLPIVTQATTLLNNFLASPTARAGIEKLTGWLEDLGSAAGEFVEQISQGNTQEALEGLFGSDTIDRAERLKDGISGISETIGNLVSAAKTGGISGLFKELFSGANVGDMAGGLGEMIGKLLMSLATKPARLLEIGLSIINGLATAMTTAIPALLPVVLQLINSFIQFVVSSLPMIMQTGIQIILALVNGIVPQLPMLIGTALELIVTLALGIAEAIPQLLPVIVGIIPKIITTLIENLPLLIEAALSIIIALAQGLIESLPTLIEAIPEIVTAIFDALIAALPMIGEAAVELVLTLIEGIYTMVPDLLTMAGELVTAIVDGIIALLPELLKVGADIVSGIWEGVKEKEAWFRQQISDFFGGIVDGIKKLLGIESPSTVFAGIGEDMAGGLGAGFGTAFKKIERDIGRTVAGLTSSVQVGGSGGALFGRQLAPSAAQISVPIQVTMQREMDIHVMARLVVDEIKRQRL